MERRESEQFLVARNVLAKHFRGGTTRAHATHLLLTWGEEAEAALIEASDAGDGPAVAERVAQIAADCMERDAGVAREAVAGTLNSSAVSSESDQSDDTSGDDSVDDVDSSTDDVDESDAAGGADEATDTDPPKAA